MLTTRVYVWESMFVDWMVIEGLKGNYLKPPQYNHYEHVNYSNVRLRDYVHRMDGNIVVNRFNRFNKSSRSKMYSSGNSQHKLPQETSGYMFYFMPIVEQSEV